MVESKNAQNIYAHDTNIPDLHITHRCNNLYHHKQLRILLKIRQLPPRIIASERRFDRYPNLSSARSSGEKPLQFPVLKHRLFIDANRL
ncbi:hypothetical protein CW696_06780 [ANME-2 cluster archaeon]|nr:MAG: hypothetical protein CW696_06780 [ANME-2 cluster archaeon]